MKFYRELKAWQRSFKLVKNIYSSSSQLPSSEKYGLKSQIERSANFIPSNIAEGQQRGDAVDFSCFIGIARGSASDLSTQLLLIQDIYILEVSQLLNEREGIQKMLYGLQAKL